MNTDQVSLLTKAEVFLTQPLIDVLGNGKIGRGSVYETRPVSLNEQQKLIEMNWPDNSAVSEGLDRYRSQAIAAVLAPSIRDSKWRLGYCYKPTMTITQCWVSTMAVSGVQAIQNNGGLVDCVFGVNEKGEIIDVRFEYFATPVELGSIPLL